MENTIFTIGHSNLNIENFINLLKEYDINCIVDVRSTPYSKFHSQFNRENIKSELKKNGIYYIFMGEELGARRNDRSLYTIKGYLDFEKTVKSSKFLKGVSRIKEGLSKGFNIALMCSEKNPMECHRSIMIARYFSDNNFMVKHILDKGEILTQEEIAKKLVDKYFPNRDQISLLPEENIIDYEELVRRSYRQRNEEIGYVIESEGEYE